MRADGTFWVVGQNTFGQLGDGTTTGRISPVQIAGNVKAAAAGSSHRFYIKTDGTLWAMCYNDYGQFGDGTKASGTLTLSREIEPLSVTVWAQSKGPRL